MSYSLSASFIDLTIPNGAGVSGWAPIARGLGGYGEPDEIPAWIEFPAAWTGTQLYMEHATTLAAPTDADARSIGRLDDGAELVIPFVARRTILLPAGSFAGLMWLRVGSGVSGTPVNQAAARTVRIGRRGFR